MNKEHVLDDFCPACSKHLDAATDLLQPLERPGWGSISLCFYCLTLLRWNPAMKLQLGDVSELDADQLLYIAKLRRMITILRKEKVKNRRR
jgi:hypothetical protein